MLVKISIALYERFKSGALALLKKHGFNVMHMWEPSDGREKLVYLLGWEDPNAREKAWHEFRFDPDWQRLKTETEAEGPLVTKMDYYLLQTAPFFSENSI